MPFLPYLLYLDIITLKLGGLMTSAYLTLLAIRPGKPIGEGKLEAQAQGMLILFLISLIVYLAV